MEPFNGLKASCPSRLPSIFSQAMAFSLFGQPTGRPNESESIMNIPLVPGDAAHPKPVPGFSFNVVVMYPAAQSPIILKAAWPLTTMSVACCQDRDEASAFVYSRMSPNISHALITSGLFQDSSPFHSFSHLSGPRTERATLSQR